MGLAQVCGHNCVSGGLKAVRNSLRSGRIHPFLAPRVPADLRIDQATFDRAVAETDWMLAAEQQKAPIEPSVDTGMSSGRMFGAGSTAATLDRVQSPCFGGSIGQPTLSCHALA